ncbi:type II toxin-antitoxin system PemK/MazF family toxin [Devosia sp.]|uniref:type II toxin-antitoxin system PemK/MazF family toxin n=1 Tax=Devosia sp. TaxID=1871048 RepID=UPI003263CFAD
MKRGEIWLVSLDPTVGSEIRKTRPSLIISPFDMNERLRTVVIVPLTSKSRPAPFRIPVTFESQPGLILLDQIRTVAKERLRRQLGEVDPIVLTQTLETLAAMFAP